MSPITYKALYRIFRPQTFVDVVGQEAVTRTLKNAIKEQRISHAYLFNGPRGTGKTSTAKIFAKAVNCQNPQEGEPCNQCTSCIGIQDGTIMDIMEIDAASNRGVDEIRDIRDKVNLRPAAIDYKVYIIDEVHMLTTEAFNALLKTLEEPPAHVIFILATTEPHKLPLTIISRCQRFDFRKIHINDLVLRLQWVSEEKGIEIDKETLQLIAALSEGGMRDALSLLDQAYSFGGNKITIEDVHLITGSLSQHLVNAILKELKGNQVAGALTLLDDAIMQGKDPEQILKSIIQYLRDLVIFQTAPELEEMRSRVTLEPSFGELAKVFQTDEIYKAIEHLNKVQNEMKWTNYPRILLEVAFIQLSETVFKQSIETLSPKVESSTNDLSNLMQKIKELEEKIEKLSSGELISQTMSAPSQAKTADEPRKRTSTANDFPILKLKALLKEGNDKYLQRMNELWPGILELVRQKEVRTEAWLKQGKPVIVTEKAILLSFNIPMHREMTEKPENKKIVMEAIQEKTNRVFDIYTIMSDQWQAFSESNKENTSETTEEEEQDPLIQQAIALVGEDLVKIKK